MGQAAVVIYKRGEGKEGEREKGGKHDFYGKKHLCKYHNLVKCCQLYTLLNLCSVIPYNVKIACLP